MLEAALDDPVAWPHVGWHRQPFTAVARWLDEAALSSLCWAFDRALASDLHEVARLRSSATPYLTPDLDREPRAFFAFVDETPTVAPFVSEPVRALPGGVLLTHTFASDYVRFDAARDDRAVDCPENAQVPVQHWVHDDGRTRGAVIALHGFTMGCPRTDAVVMQARAWYDAGLDVVLPTLPFHGARSPRWAPHSGALFGSWDVGRLNEAVRQSVWDVHRVSAWFRHTYRGPLGLFGVSLGGYVTALLAELSAAWDFVMPVAPAVCLASLPVRLFARSRHGRRTAPPLAIKELRAGYRVHSPLRHALRVAKVRVLVAAGRADRVVPPAHARALWRHWGEPAMRWFDGGHFAPFGRSAIVAAGIGHLRGLGILG